MKAILKCQLYLIILLAAMLFMVNTATSKDHTEVLTEETQQMTKNRQL